MGDDSRLIKFQRGVRMDTSISQRMVWFSECGQYAVARYKPELASMDVSYQAYRTDGQGNLAETISNRLSTRVRAESACRRHLRGDVPCTQ